MLSQLVRRYFGSLAKRRPYVRPHHRRSTLSVEVLEDRATPSSLAVLSTDASDYAPGSTATFQGTGFEIGENINIAIVADNGNSESLSVTDGGANDADGGADGNFTTTWLVDAGGAYLDATVTATAVGDLGSEASTTFTDGKPADPGPPPPAPSTRAVGALDNETPEALALGATLLTAHNDIRYGLPNTYSSVTSVIRGATDAVIAATDLNKDSRLNDVVVQLQHSSFTVNETVVGTIDGNNDIVFTWTIPAEACLSINVQYASAARSGFTAADRDIIADGVWDGNGAGSPAGYEMLNPDGTADDHCGNDITSTVTLEGRKFEDINGNGADDSDPGIVGWHVTVWVDSNGDSIQDSGEVHDVVTGTGGVWSYSEEVLDSILSTTGAAYSASEVQQTGWTQTFGNAGYAGAFTTSNTSVAGADFGNFKNFDICGTKFYDNNANGKADDSATVEGWTIVMVGPNGMQTTTTAANGTYRFTDLGPGSYAVTEAAGGAGWIQTYGIDGYLVTGSSGVDSGGNNFGNLLECKGSGGVTLGFWSNKNGQAVLNADGFTDDSALLSSLYLKNANGSNFDPTSYSSLKTWLLNATATNMSYMLSAQLATTQLAVLEAGTGAFGGLSGTTIVDTGTLLTSFAASIPGLNVVVDSLGNTHGFITINDLMAAANNQLCIDADGKSLSGDANRAIEEALKTALDLLNNNKLSFVMNVLGSISASATC